MSSNLSTAGTAHVKAIADRALMSDKGISITCASHGEAMKLRQLLHQLRSVDRRRNRKLPFDDPKYGTSIYDSLGTTILEDGVTILIRTGVAYLQTVTITDNETGEIIPVEDL